MNHERDGRHGHLVQGETELELGCAGHDEDQQRHGTTGVDDTADVFGEARARRRLRRCHRHSGGCWVSIQQHSPCVQSLCPGTHSCRVRSCSTGSAKPSGVSCGTRLSSAARCRISLAPPEVFWPSIPSS